MSETDGTVIRWFILEVQGQYFLTGDVVEDRRGRWRSGDYMFSSAIINMNLESNIVRTQNSTYSLSGPGEVRQVSVEHALLMRQGVTFGHAELLLAGKHSSDDA